MIQIHYFAHLREQTGIANEELALAGETVTHLKQVIAKKYPLITLSSVMVAVNEDFVHEETRLVSGDVVALIPPVSGG